MRNVWGQLGLRARIMGLYALGGLLLSLIIAVATLTLARQNLLEDREDRAFPVAVRNAARVEGALSGETEIKDVQTIFDLLNVTERSVALVRLGTESTSGSPQVFNQELIPSSLRAQVDAGNAARMRTRVNGTHMILTGIPIPDVDADYYEAALTDDVEDALDALGIIVLGVAAATTLLSAALGSWASRRALTPLADVRIAAESLAAGELDTRLEPPADADLASLTASFNGMARSLEDRVERDARFASEVSHELRSPLMTLSASIEVLQNGREQLSERSQMALDLLTDDIQRFTLLVEDLLEISRYDVGTASLQAEPIDLIEFARQSIRHLPHDNVNVDFGDLEHLVFVGDKRRLAQVITNLVDNAAKYGAGAITVTLSEHDGSALLAVEDEGVGVLEAERTVIFDRFSRGSAGGRRGQGTGSGLGLALVAEHVGLHRGTVWVEDREDGKPGARFVVQLPIDEISEFEGEFE
jgi:two-component system sensor histidine kinase MtrB